MKFFERKRKPTARIPEAVFLEVDALMNPFLHRYARPEAQFRLSASLEGNTITISENRPAYLSKKVEDFPIARADYDPTTRLWSLYCYDQNSEWVFYEPLEPTRDFAALLNLMEEEPIFLG